MGAIRGGTPTGGLIPGKESAGPAREQADLIRVLKVSCPSAKGLTKKLDLLPKEFCGILDAAGIKLCECEFGVF